MPATSPSAAPSEAEAATADEAFWRAKLARDLRDAGTWEPTPDEKAYWEALQIQDHLGLSDTARGSDYVLRRPELYGGRR